MGCGRTRKQVKLDKKQKYSELAGRKAEENARKTFNRDVRKEYGVKQCLAKWGVDLKGGIAGGQEKIEKVHTEQGKNESGAGEKEI